MVRPIDADNDSGHFFLLLTGPPTSGSRNLRFYGSTCLPFPARDLSREAACPSAVARALKRAGARSVAGPGGR
jgi:hypothetical protein